MDLVREHFCVVCGASNKADQGRCFACGSSLKTTQPLPSVASVSLLNGRYHLLEQVGQGGFSVVYKAEDAQTGQVIAIKATSLRGLSSQEKIDATDTFNREVSLLSQVSHGHLPRIYDHFSDTECWYLVMEFIDGITLEKHLERYGKRSLSLEEVLKLGLQLCDVLIYLHERQPAIIFRDLKPANIMLTRDGKLFLIDFGIARRFIPGKAKDTIPFGSPGYAAPEQYGRAQSGTHSDIYSLGAILHQLVSGDDPAQNPFKFAPLRGRPELAQLDRLIQQMVSLDSNQRPENLQIVKYELEQIALQHGLQLPPTNPLSTPIHTSSMSPLIWSQASTPVSQTQSPPRQAFLARPVVVRIGLLLVLLVGFLLYVTVPPVVTETPSTSTNPTTVATPHSFHHRAVAPYTSMFGVDAAQTRFDQDEHTLDINNVEQLKTMWSGNTGDIIYSSPAVANGIVYISSNDNKLHAFDAQTGQQIWTTSLETDPSPTSSPAVANGIVYVGSEEHNLYALDAETGQVKWTASTGGIIASSPTVTNSTVYVSSYDHKLYAFDAQTGRVKWADLTNGTIGSSPAVASGIVYVTTNFVAVSKLYAIDAATGKQRWSIPVRNALSADVAERIVYVSTSSGQLYAFDAKTGQQKWVAQARQVTASTETNPIDFLSPPAVANGVVYVCGSDGEFDAFDAQTGQQKWASSFEMDAIPSSPIIANDVIYIGIKNHFYALDAATGQPMLDILIYGLFFDGSSPAMANGMVYAIAHTQAGQAWLYAFGVAPS